MDKARIEALKNKLQMMAKCIFIAADEVVAKDISAGLHAAMDTIDTLTAERDGLRGALICTTDALTAANSLLSRSPKTAAPSDKMFDQMLIDYKKSEEIGRTALLNLELPPGPQEKDQ